MKKVLAAAILAVIGLVLFAIPRSGHTANDRAEAALWQKNSTRPTQWLKELGESSGEIRLAVERNRNNVVYVLLKRCNGADRFYSLGWSKGQPSATGYTCDGRHLYATDTGFWEKRGGELPPELKAFAEKAKSTNGKNK